MPLTRLGVRNFRGLRDARLEFGEIAVWVGENGAGKSSLFDALALVLGPAPEGTVAAFCPGDFHRPRGGKGGPISITVELVEPAAGRWRCLDAAVLQPVVRSDEDGVRRISLRLKARRGRSGGIDARAEALDWDSTDRRVDLDQDLLSTLREASPVVVLRGGRLVTQVRALPGASRDHGAEAVRGRLESFHRHLAGGEHVPPEAGMREGLLAAFELARVIGRSTDLARATPTALITAMAQALNVNGGPPVGCKGDRAGDEPPLPLAQHGAGAVLVGVLFLLGALFTTTDDASGASPVVLMEQPEAGLHPILLAAVWRLIEGMSLQRVVATESGVLLSSAPLAALRRLYRRDGTLQVRHLHADSLEPDELRKVSYHVRARRGEALFARCWLLVEGESEFWYLPGFGGLLGFDLAAEGVACVEFAQCGVRPLVRLADALGIEWHVLCDGDNAGNAYRSVAQGLLDGRPPERHISQLGEPDIERCLRKAGYDTLIEPSLHRGSKPALAMAILDAAREPDSPGVPPVLEVAIRTSVEMARSQGPVMASFA